jgi:hypothetical protein
MDEYCYAVDIYNDWGHFYETEPVHSYETGVHSTEYKNNNELHEVFLDEEWGHFVDIDNDIKMIDNDIKMTDNDKKIKTRYKNDYCYEKPQNTSLATNVLLRISSTTLFTIGFAYLILSIL